VQHRPLGINAFNAGRRYGQGLAFIVNHATELHLWSAGPVIFAHCQTRMLPRLAHLARGAPDTYRLHVPGPPPRKSQAGPLAAANFHSGARHVQLSAATTHREPCWKNFGHKAGHYFVTKPRPPYAIKPPSCRPGCQNRVRAENSLGPRVKITKVGHGCATWVLGATRHQGRKGDRIRCSRAGHSEIGPHATKPPTHRAMQSDVKT